LLKIKRRLAREGPAGHCGRVLVGPMLASFAKERDRFDAMRNRDDGNAAVISLAHRSPKPLLPS